jgi:predicted acylesterase/phospholipase RssA
MQKPRRYFIISGGASHGATLWGALLAALDRYTPIGYAGASIGAVICAGMALGIDRTRLEASLVKLFQHNRLTGGAKLLRPHPRVFWARGGGLHDWTHVRAALKDLFGDARMRDVKVPLTIVVGDCYTGTPTYITSESHPDALVWEVLACSTAIAPIADAQEAPSLGTGNRLYVDGGWGDNVPVSAFGAAVEPSVVIFLAKSRDGAPVIEPRSGFIGVLTACLEMSLYANPNIVGRSDDIMLPIVPKGSGLDFDLTAKEIRRRVLDGAAQACLLLREVIR